jgi:Predicted membrane protein
VAKRALTRRHDGKASAPNAARRDTKSPARVSSGSSAATAVAARIGSLDALRGVAIVAMIAYHLGYDLRYFGVTHSDLEHDWRWIGARSLILASFLAVAGISAVLAEQRSRPLVRWLRHVLVIAASALLVSAGSWMLFPRSFIWFGVLHAIAVSLLLAKPLVARPALAAFAGVLVIVAGATYTNPLFDTRTLGWIGFMTEKPVTEDYVPLFPWLGVLLVGIALGHALVRARFAALAPLARLPGTLRFLGRHSLLVYLLHQPLLIGSLWLALKTQASR